MTTTLQPRPYVFYVSDQPGPGRSPVVLPGGSVVCVRGEAIKDLDAMCDGKMAPTEQLMNSHELAPMPPAPPLAPAFIDALADVVLAHMPWPFEDVDRDGAEAAGAAREIVALIAPIVACECADIRAMAAAIQPEPEASRPRLALVKGDDTDGQ